MPGLRGQTPALSPAEAQSSIGSKPAESIEGPQNRQAVAETTAAAEATVPA